MEDRQDFSPFFNSNFPHDDQNDKTPNLPNYGVQILKIIEEQPDNNSTGKLMSAKDISYFNIFFSPKQTAQSLKRRNDNLEMLNFQNSDEEPDDVFNRRKKKVLDLFNKQQQQLNIIIKIKQEDQGKYFAIIQFIKFFCQLKEKLGGLRTDYYSSKTFCALKNANQSQLSQLLKTVQKMYYNVIAESKSTADNSQTTGSHLSRVDLKISEFLIIPRFLISKQKINRLCRDEILQKNFQFLVFHQCLGHYNNEANKKLPEESQMIYVRQLLNKKMGRYKFKKICSINHGSKFLKSHGGAYYQLYSKSYQYLKQLDNYIKKGKKYETIKRELDKIPNSDNDQIFGSSFYTQNDSSNNSAYNFKNIHQCLNKIEKSEDNSQIKSQMKDQLDEIVIPTKEMKKNTRVRKLMSMPLVQEKEEGRPRQFSVRKSHTMQPKTTQNIILVPPPSYFQK